MEKVFMKRKMKDLYCLASYIYLQLLKLKQQHKVYMSISVTFKGSRAAGIKPNIIYLNL